MSLLVRVGLLALCLVVCHAAPSEQGYAAQPLDGKQQQEPRPHFFHRWLAEANLTMDDLPPEAQVPLPPGPDEPLSADDILECQKEAVAQIKRLMGLDMDIAFNATAMQDMRQYELAYHIFTPDYCQGVIHKLHELDARDIPRNWIVNPDGEAVQVPEEEDDRRFLQAVSTVPTFGPPFQKDVDPNNDSFTLDKLGKGYPAFTGAALAFTYNYTYDQYGVDPRRTGIYLAFVWTPAKTAQYIIEIYKTMTAFVNGAVCIIPWPFGGPCPFTTIAKEAAKQANGIAKTVVSATSAVKNSFDFLYGGLNGVKTKSVFDNAKRVINDQKRAVDQLKFAAGAIEQTSVNLVIADRAVVTLESTTLDNLDQIGTQLDVLQATLVEWVNRLGVQVADLISREGAAISTTLTNAELRMENTLINTIFDKLSIDGVNRPDRLPVPAPFNATVAPLANITSGRRRKLTTAEEETGLPSFAGLLADLPEEEESGLSDEELYASYFVRRLQFSNATTYPSSAYRSGYGCDGNDNNNNGQVDECTEDVIKPIMKIDQAVAGSRRSWFTDAGVVRTFIQRTVQAFDDCGLASVTSPVLMGLCKNASVSVVSADKCGNTESATVPVWYDPAPPAVAFALQPDPKILDPKIYALKAVPYLVDIGLVNTTITDNCDPNSFLKINVYSDELSTFASKSLEAAVLRMYDANNNNAFVGWRVMVLPWNAVSCKTTACDVADGRFFFVVICAKDEAGQETCFEQSIGVSLGLHKPAPIPQGKLFLLAHDSAYYRQPPMDNMLSLSPNTFTVHS